MKKLLVSLFSAFLVCNVSVARQRPVSAVYSDKEALVWVDSVFNSMNAERRVGQLIAQVVDPRNLSAAKSVVKKNVEKYNIGFIYFSIGSLQNHAELANYTNSLSQLPVIVSLDGEWGLSMRMSDTPRFPKNMMLGAIQDDRLLYDYGKEMARECKEVGVNLNFAPDVDVNSNPANPVIGTRSFGEDPQNVARKAVAYAKGLEDNGVLSSSKHFPGHGDTNEDSHKTLPTVSRSLIELQSTDLLPFHSYIRAGLSGVMVGHLNVPALKTGNLPTSLCHNVVTEFLKEQMGFDGLVYTDGLQMKGSHMDGKPNGLRALMAGADVLLEPYRIAEDYEEMVAAYKKGGKIKERVDEACRKILRYKYAIGLDKYRPVDLQGLKERINSTEAELVSRRLFASAITALKNEADMLPLKELDKEVSVVSLGASADNRFSQTCRLYTDVKRYSMNDDNSSEVIGRIKTSSKVIVGVFKNDLTTAMNLDRIILDCGADKVIPVFFVTPYALAKYSGSITLCNTAVLAYENEELAQEYAAQAVFGGISVTGRIPVTVEGVADCGDGVTIHASRLGYGIPEEVGFDSRLVAGIDSLANLGVEKGAFPGCQVLVAHNGKIVVNKCYGFTDLTKNWEVNGNTIYDLASVSKATGTLAGVMKAVDNGLMSVDAKLGNYVKELDGTEKGNLTIRDLLYHETGMPAALNIYQIMTDTASYEGSLVVGRKKAGYSRYAGGGYINDAAKVRRDITSPVKTDDFDYHIGKRLYVGKTTRDTIMNIIHNQQLRPDRNYLYSCLNFCMLMEAEEKATGVEHDKWVRDNIFHRLGAYRSVYRPLDYFSEAEIAATEYDGYLRECTVKGSVHDETAAFSGGVQGNAGFFSNANDLAKLCGMWLNGGMYGGEQILSERTVRLFTESKSPNSYRGLGFDKPNVDNPEKSSVCEEADPSVYGHTGFTGTSFWVDPKNDLIYIFLCNRVCPTRNNREFGDVGARFKIFSVIYNSLGITADRVQSK